MQNNKEDKKKLND